MPTLLPAAPLPKPSMTFKLAGRPYLTDPTTFDLLELCFFGRRVISGQAQVDFDWIITTGLANGRIVPAD